MILLDTDVCIEILRGNQNVIARREKENDTIAISFLTVGEMYYGVHKSNAIEHNMLQVEKFLLSVHIVHSDLSIMKLFGQIKSRLQQSSNVIPDADILIASTALSKSSKLITGNIDHFKRIDELKIENWIR